MLLFAKLFPLSSLYTVLSNAWNMCIIIWLVNAQRDYLIRWTDVSAMKVSRTTWNSGVTKNVRVNDLTFYGISTNGNWLQDQKR